MTITLQSVAAKGEGTTSAALPWPASIAARDLLIAHGMSKPFGAFPTWASVCPLASVADGAIAAGADVGSTISTSAVRVATANITGTETMTVAAGTPALGVISRWTCDADKVWSVQASQGADSTLTTTPVSAAGTTLTVQPGDVIVVTVSITSDTITHTSQTVTIPGATLSAMTWETVFTTTQGNQGSMYVGRCTVTAGTVTAAPLYTATSSLSGQSACGVTFIRLREQAAQLPGLMMGVYGDPMVEPESHSHNPPIIDSNGNLYRIGESNLAHSTNRLLVHKSSDGGITWQSVDWANHPTAQDLECTWVQKIATKFYVLITRDDTVWLVPFNMSDDASPDTYGTQEVVDTALSSTGVVQYCSFTVLSDSTMQCFYSDLLNGVNNQIGYRKRTAVNTYTAKTTFNDGAAQNVTGPAAVLGASDVTYVFYKDKTADILYYRTVSAAGTISAKTAVASAASISSQSMPHTNPIYYDDAGVEVIGIAYINDSDILKYRELRGGVLQAEETISTAALTRNPGTTDSQAVVANLAIDAATGTVHCMWSRAADGDLMRAYRVRGVGWGPNILVWSSAGQTGWYVYCDVVQYGPDTKLIYTYDQGIHVDDASNITYNELTVHGPTIDALLGQPRNAPAFTRMPWGVSAPSQLVWAGEDPPAGGGANWPVDQTDSAGLTDTAVLDPSTVITDAVGLTDSTALTQSRTTADSAGLTDNATQEIAKLVAATDDAGLTDTAALTRATIATDSTGLTDTTPLTQAKTFTDSSGLTDTSSTDLGKLLTQTDPAGLTDTSALTRATAATDSAGLTDTATFTRTLVLLDAAGLTDTATALLLKLLTQTDSAGLSDGVSPVLTIGGPAVLTDVRPGPHGAPTLTGQAASSNGLGVHTGKGGIGGQATGGGLDGTGSSGGTLT
jgi:hypothetical protein